MALQGATPEAPMAEELLSAPPSDPRSPQPHSTPTNAVKPLRPKGHPRKVKAAVEQSAAPSVISNPIGENPALTSTHKTNGAAPAKSELTISEPRRHPDKTHLKFVASQP